MLFEPQIYVITIRKNDFRESFPMKQKLRVQKKNKRRNQKEYQYQKNMKFKTKMIPASVNRGRIKGGGGEADASSFLRDRPHADPKGPPFVIFETH